MKITKVCSLILLLLPHLVSAQEEDSVSGKRPAYFNQINSGILFGKKSAGNTVMVSTLHGIRVHRLFIGAGLGYEHYTERELMPVFASGAVALMNPDHSHLFVELQYGYSKAWHSINNFDPYKYRERGGVMFNAQLGYRIKADKFSMYLKAGYKAQKLKYEQYLEWVNNYSNKIERVMERLNASIGIGFN